jgi:hypothetical protein
MSSKRIEELEALRGRDERIKELEDANKYLVNYAALVAENESLRVQLTAAQAEIERLKITAQKMPVDEVEEHFCLLESQLAAAQAEIERTQAEILQFVDRVAEMRAAQQGYFKTRSRELLINSKQLEAEVDRGIAAIRTSKQEAIAQEISQRDERADLKERLSSGGPRTRMRRRMEER